MHNRRFGFFRLFVGVGVAALALLCARPGFAVEGKVVSNDKLMSALDAYGLKRAENHPHLSHHDNARSGALAETPGMHALATQMKAAVARLFSATTMVVAGQSQRQGVFRYDIFETRPMAASPATRELAERVGSVEFRSDGTVAVRPTKPKISAFVFRRTLNGGDGTTYSIRRIDQRPKGKPFEFFRRETVPFGAFNTPHKEQKEPVSGVFGGHALSSGGRMLVGRYLVRDGKIVKRGALREGFRNRRPETQSKRTTRARRVP